MSPLSFKINFATVRSDRTDMNSENNVGIHEIRSRHGSLNKVKYRFSSGGYINMCHFNWFIILIAEITCLLKSASLRIYLIGFSQLGPDYLNVTSHIQRKIRIHKFSWEIWITLFLIFEDIYAHSSCGRKGSFSDQKITIYKTSQYAFTSSVSVIFISLASLSLCIQILVLLFIFSSLCFVQ